MFSCPAGVEEFSQEFQPINADSMRGPSMVEWFLSPGMSKRQRVEWVEWSNAHAASETLGAPVEKSASDDVRTDFGCHEWLLSQDRFNRPAGTRLFSSSFQALRAWLLSCCPSGTKTIRPSKGLALSQRLWVETLG